MDSSETLPMGIAVWLLLALSPQGQAQARPTGQVKPIQAEGCGTILGGDTARARDEAIIDAWRQAIEQAAGGHMEQDHRQNRVPLRPYRAHPSGRVHHGA